jgi:hypothetical protein
MSVIVNASTSTGLGITSDNSGTVEIQSNGTTKLTVASTGAYGTVTTATAQASTSGTQINFTGIPSWAKKITVMFNEVSVSGTSNFLIQIGSGSIETTGYLSTSTYIDQAGGTSGVSSTTGFVIFSNSASLLTSGQYSLTLLNSNLWISSGITRQSTTQLILCAGNKTTAGSLDLLRITTVNGTDTFDAGSVNIMYEG